MQGIQISILQIPLSHFLCNYCHILHFFIFHKHTTLCYYFCFRESVTLQSSDPPSDIWQHLEILFVVPTGKDATGTCWVEARDDAKHCAMHLKTPFKKELSKSLHQKVQTPSYRINKSWDVMYSMVTIVNNLLISYQQ